MRELAGPVGVWRKRRMQRLLRHTDLMHHRAEFRRVEMTGDKAERLERLQQRRQQRHDVVDHRVGHVALVSPAMQIGAEACPLHRKLDQ
ncbi:MAG: hypothetical protein H7316_01505 [Tardiphaga sp.]|uniref:hypothetical protein n=1 Tax=Tardiphaga sp. TaxID=1926292 RepID=UPI001990E9D9|nr:hypothetical protein [Tardiphaga sp.]MBC7582407.1 hypothetical protein [Tardiphaga sp.]